MTTMSAQIEAIQPITGADRSAVVESARRLHAALERYAPGAADWLYPALIRVLRGSMPNEPTHNAKLCSVALDTPEYLFQIDPGYVKRMAGAADDQVRRQLLWRLQEELRSRMPFRAFDFVTNGVAVLRFQGHDDQILPQELAEAIARITLRHGFRERTLDRTSRPFFLGAQTLGGGEWEHRTIKVAGGQVITGEPLPSIEYAGHAGDGPFTASLDLKIWPLVVDLDRGEAGYPVNAMVRLLPLRVPVDPRKSPEFPDLGMTTEETRTFWEGLAGGLDAALADAPGGTESCPPDGLGSWPSSHPAGNATMGSTTAQCAAVDLTPAILRAARKLSQQTQAQLGERIGVSKMTVSNWESGRKPIPKNRQAEPNRAAAIPTGKAKKAIVEPSRVRMARSIDRDRRRRPAMTGLRIVPRAARPVPLYAPPATDTLPRRLSAVTWPLRDAGLYHADRLQRRESACSPCFEVRQCG